MPYIPRKPRTTKYVRKGNKGQRKSTLVNTVKKVVKSQAETKSRVLAVTEATDNTITNPTGWHALNTVAQGTDKENRTGNMITPTWLDVRGQVQSSYQDATYYRVIVFEKNIQSNPLTDLLEDDSGNFAPASGDLKAIYARINTAKFRILGSRVLKLGTQSNTANDRNSVQMFHMKMKLGGKMFFDEGQVNPQRRQIGLLVIGRRANNDDTAGHAFELTFNSKFYYKDM